MTIVKTGTAGEPPHDHELDDAGNYGLTSSRIEGGEHVHTWKAGQKETGRAGRDRHRHPLKSATLKSVNTR